MPIHFPSVPATFINIPKTGTTSLKFWALEHIKDLEITSEASNLDWVSHMSNEELHAKWANLGTTFAFVRNPYDRLVSVFHHLGQNAEERLNNRKAGIMTRDMISVPIESDIRILGVYRKGFEHWIKTDHSSKTDCPMIRMLQDAKKETQLQWLDYELPNIVIKIEDVNTEFHIIQKLLNCQEPFIHTNISSHKPYKEYYTEETQKIVAEWVKEDLEAFGYEF